MIDVIETEKNFILVCNYKPEINLIDDLLNSEFSGATYEQSSYEGKPAVILTRDNAIPEAYQNGESMQELVDKQILHVHS